MTIMLSLLVGSPYCSPTGGGSLIPKIRSWTIHIMIAWKIQLGAFVEWSNFLSSNTQKRQRIFPWPITTWMVMFSCRINALNIGKKVSIGRFSSMSCIYDMGIQDTNFFWGSHQA